MKLSQIHFTKFARVMAIVFVVFGVIAFTYFQQAQATAGINPTINFQGKVVNKTAGTNVTDGNYDFTFKLYDAASSGTLLWTENWTGGNQVTVTDGIFRVALGSLTSLSSVDFNSDSLYLDITFNGEAMGSRIKFASVPYAFNAQKVNGLTVTNNGGNTLSIAASKTFTVSNSLTLAGTDSTSFTFPSTGGGTVLVNNISGQSIAGAFSLTGTSGNLTLAGTTGLTFSGTGGDITFTNGEKIDNDTDGLITITGDLSSSGLITAASGLTLTSGPITLGGVTGSGQCLVGGASASWGSCGSGSGTNYWNLVSGIGVGNGGYITPINSTVDFLIGGQATSSAKFAFLNVDSGTPTATISGNSGNIATYLTGTGNLQTTNGQTLTLGGSTTGDILLSAGNGSGVIRVNNPTSVTGLSFTNAITASTGRAIDVGTLSSSAIGYVAAVSSNGIGMQINHGFGSTATGIIIDDSATSHSGFTGLKINLTRSASHTGLYLAGSASGTTSLTGHQIWVAPTYTFTGNVTNTENYIEVTRSDTVTSGATANQTGDLVKFSSNCTETSATCVDTSNVLRLTQNFGKANGAVLNIVNFGVGSAAAILSNSGGQAALQVNKTGNAGDILTASASGTTKFTVDLNGLGTFAGGLTLSSGPITLGGLTGSGQCLVGGASASWGSCGSGSGSNFWNLVSGIGVGNGGYITPINSTADFLIGGQATSSAKFAFTGLSLANNQTQASISGQLIVMPNNGYSGRIGVGVTNPGAQLQVNGLTGSSADLFSVNDSSGAQQFYVNSGGNVVVTNPAGMYLTAINNTSSGNNANLALTANGTTINRNIADSNPALVVNLLHASSTGDVLQLANNSSTLFAFTRTGGITLAGITGSNGNCLLSGGAGNPVSWGSCGSGSNFWNLVSGNGVSTGGYITPINSTADFLLGGQATASAKFAVLNLNSGTPVASIAGNMIIMPVSGAAGRLGIGTTAPNANLEISKLAAGGLGPTILLSNNGGSGNEAANIDFGRDSTNVRTRLQMIIYGGGRGGMIFSTGASSISNEVFRTDSSMRFGYGTSSPVGQFSVTRPLAWGVTGKALGIFDQIENQDILAASASGTTVFSITRTGGISLGDSENVGNNGECLKSQGAGSASIWDTCGGSSSVNYLGQANGLTWIGNTTTDFAIGGSATSSAKFVFGGINAGTPTATFSGDLIMNNKPTTAATDMQRWTQITGTAGTIGGNATTGIASVSASVVYNGSLYVGTSKSNGAEVYRYEGTGAGTWTKVSNSTAGTIASGGTANIDMVSSMTVWNGSLYIGTTEPNAAEVYRYDGSNNWTKVSQATAGTIRSGGTASIDGISSMVVHQSKMYIGTLEGAKAEVYRYESGTSWIIISTTAGTYVTSNVVNVDAITSMVSYQGSLYLMTKKTNDADFLRWTGVPGANGQWPQLDGGTTTASYSIYNTENGSAGTVTNSDEGQLIVYAGRIVLLLSNFGSTGDILMWNPNAVATTTNTFIRFNAASGQIATGGTSNIDGFGSAAIYNGRLYVGTSEPNSAQIYRFNGAMGDWTLISQNTAGQIQGGGTTGIDSISTLIQYNHNSLFAGILEGTSAQGYQYSSSIDQSYALKFNAYSGIAGGEQNLNENLGQIFFVASLSANLNNRQGNTGAFVFSHNIVTNNGSYDVAEDYPTRDETLEPGDVVSVDSGERGFVKKSDSEHDYSTIGVYSENPALRLSQDSYEINGGRVIPVALAGRVPVKVSTENGKIKAGDALTSSSKPGVAMKAKKAGVVIGVAMADYDSEGVGKVLAYIKSTSYNGDAAANFANLDINSESFASDALNELMSNPSNGKSSVFTDRVIAGLEIVTPRITADTIIARKIKADEIELPTDFLEKAFKNGGIKSVDENKLVDLQKEVAVLSAQAQDASKSAEANKLKLLESINEKLASSSNSATVTQNSLFLNNLSSDGLVVFNDSIRVKNNGLFEGLLTVVDTITTNNFIANGLSTFFGQSVFKDTAQFEKPVTFSNDIGGTAVVNKNTNQVEVDFDKDFDQTPVINASVSFDLQKDSEGNDVDNQALVDEYFAQKYSYVIVGKSSKGFTIILNKKAVNDVYFTWTALRVKDARTIHSRAPN